MTLSLWRVKTETGDNEESSCQDKSWGQCDGHRSQRAVNFSNNHQNWKGRSRLPFSSEGISTVSVGTWDLQPSDNGADFYGFSFLIKAESTVFFDLYLYESSTHTEHVVLLRFLSFFFLSFLPSPPRSLSPFFALFFSSFLFSTHVFCFLHML